ncbi:MAG TPA: hypothetical protein VFI28_03780 [Candidatus Limnocylindrales bacterium]|nr:hypothetical protein [Candidatus Limnocylindrales bacterium]
MQLLFGVAGRSSRAPSVFASLMRWTGDSNPGVNPTISSEAGLLIGRVARSFGTWRSGDGSLSVWLDGRVDAIDGRETGNHGTSEGDLAAIAELHRTLGSRLWERLEGSFCLIVRDGESVTIGVDVAGTRGVYWYVHDGLLAFHTHLLDLVPSYPAPLAEDLGAIGTYLASGSYLRAITPFRAVRRLAGGEYVELRDGRADAHRHFTFAFDGARRGASAEVLADELGDLASTSIRRAWRSARAPIVPLSGGLDSRYLAAEIATVAGPDTIRTITWGEQRERPGSDGVIAPLVAATIGAENVWHERAQRHTSGTVSRRLYLSSGEGSGHADAPVDHLLHEGLAEQGFESMFRGDHQMGQAKAMLTGWGLLAGAGIVRLAHDDGYAGVLDPELVARFSDAQDEAVERALSVLVSPTATGRLHELRHEVQFNRQLAASNVVKHADLEVYVPLLDRALVEWVRHTPDALRAEKRLLALAFRRRFPALADIPFATRTNLPDWERRWQEDPRPADFFAALCEEPGWLSTIGAQERVVEAFRRLAADARARAARRAGEGSADPPTSERPVSGGAVARLRDAGKRSLAGRLAREWTLERRSIGSTALHSRLTRLATLHVLLGKVEARRALDASAADSDAVPATT